VLTCPSESAAEAAAELAARGTGPPIADNPAELFGGDTVVLAHMNSAFVQLLPAWLRSAEQAMATLNLIMLRCEAWVLGVTSTLVGALRLRSLAGELEAAIPLTKPVKELRRLLLNIKNECRIALAYFGQVRDAHGHAPVCRSPRTHRYLRPALLPYSLASAGVCQPGRNSDRYLTRWSSRRAAQTADHRAVYQRPLGVCKQRRWSTPPLRAAYQTCPTCTTNQPPRCWHQAPNERRRRPPLPLSTSLSQRE